MKKKSPNFSETVRDAIDRGDCDALVDAYEKHADIFNYGHTLKPYSKDYYDAAINQARKDPEGLQRDMLAEMLALQRMLHHRSAIHVKRSIEKHDAGETGGLPIWGRLPEELVEETIPRLGRLDAEIRATISSMRQLDKHQRRESNAAE